MRRGVTAIRVAIDHNPVISAVYAGLLATGYEFALVEKPAPIREAILALPHLSLDTVADSFFRKARQETCEAYPYWPRAALLETATFFMSAGSKRYWFHDFGGYREYVMRAPAILHAEKSAAFWRWIEAFPVALTSVVSGPGFGALNAWVQGWVEQEAVERLPQLETLSSRLTRLLRNHGLGFDDLIVILSPIKCAYSADHFVDGSKFYAILGSFNTASVVHELMHMIVHPVMMEKKAEMLAYSGWQVYDMDPSYSLGNDDRGFLNAFEEVIVRKLSADFGSGLDDVDVLEYIRRNCG
jgi:hypothetical protein